MEERGLTYIRSEWSDRLWVRFRLDRLFDFDCDIDLTGIQWDRLFDMDISLTSLF